ncbi:hypothetical protein BDA96_04G341600 [Sorghum bicolor]|jgi:hypothetical protein|uniref:Uncharacterized protein n=2 Tax=Sorghum bicolor TaxID=4558 RepID=A0A921R9K8_SORBI|nr:uncharacterized protein LOC8082687 [Sorghum bicolor]EES05899.1 hypothetical protein SORBI_3004G319100 [Sorghum bicolor]KAG0535146.1 hypothetical protein BDA96_04G341600 [Sorghum bicolor]KAG0535147.1 hypothetical protein BDA96_04G341600 [Sorghum bicolor]|eukprot:XP_002452923.1 uncharacterized protein LOC8082687 [Sorghum bicolor]
MGDDQQLVAAARVAPRRPMMFRVPRRPVARAAVGGGEASPLLPAGPTRKKKKKMAVARLGGKRRLFGAIRRLRMRWLAVLYRRTLRRLRAYYATAINDLLEGAAVISSLRGPTAGTDCAFGTAFAPVVTVGI